MVFVPVHCLGNPKVSDQRVTEKIGLANKVCAGGPLVCCSLSKLVTRSSTFIVKPLGLREQHRQKIVDILFARKSVQSAAPQGPFFRGAVPRKNDDVTEDGALKWCPNL
jgi:hypothetical protein